MAENETVIVIGGGISGLTSAVEAAEAGCDVVIIEKNPYLGGRVAQLNKYFWKLCPPTCGLEIQFKRIKNSQRVKVYTLAEVTDIKGEEGNFDVTVKLSPRYVNDKCVSCDACAQACSSYRENDFNFGMDKTKAAYLPFNQAFPAYYVIDREACDPNCKKCEEACKYYAVDLNMKTEMLNLKAGAIIMATGWNPYDAKKIDNLGFGKVRNVITNMMMERISAVNGPTRGKIVRPSDSKEVKNIAFVQCAGSRDENHLPFCSYICCLASLKQAFYVREQYPDSRAQIYYIDLRTPGLYEHRFLKKAQDDPNITLTKGKVAGVSEDPVTGDVIIDVEDVSSGKKVKERFDMVVLAAGMEPTTRNYQTIKEVSYTPDGFVDTSMKKGIYAIGAIRNPVDVIRSTQDATGAVIKSLQSLNGRGR